MSQAKHRSVLQQWCSVESLDAGRTLDAEAVLRGRRLGGTWCSPVNL